MEWIKMEDIFQSVFVVRCYRQMDTDFPVLRGIPKPFYQKCLLGGTIIFILFTLIWSPFFIFAVVGRVGVANVPHRADMSLTIGEYEPIYISYSYSGIHPLSQADYEQLQNTFANDKLASDHISIYDAVDISAIKFDANSVTLWNLTPPDKKRLINSLQRGKGRNSNLVVPNAFLNQYTYQSFVLSFRIYSKRENKSLEITLCYIKLRFFGHNCTLDTLYVCIYFTSPICFCNTML